MITFQYILLHLLVVIVAYCVCVKIKKAPSKDYWKIASLCILIFTLEEGLRWGRMIDWCMYHESYSNMLRYGDENSEPIFRLVWYSLALLHVPYCGVIALMSFLLISSLFYFCRPYKNILPVVIPLLVVTAGYFAENLIRWYMSYSFLLIALRLYYDGKRKYALLWGIVSVCCHYAMILSIFLFLAIYFFRNKRLCSAKMAILVSISFVVLIGIYKDLMMNLIFIANAFSGSERFAMYSEDSSDWFVVKDSNVLGNILTMIPLYVVLWGASKKSTNTHWYNIIYNSFIVSLWIKSLGQDLELALRYRAIFDPFVCLMVGIVFYSYSNSKRLKRLYSPIVSLYIVLQVIRFCSPLPNEKLNMYVWNEIRPAYELLGVHKGWWK